MRIPSSIRHACPSIFNAQAASSPANFEHEAPAFHPARMNAMFHIPFTRLILSLLVAGWDGKGGRITNIRTIRHGGLTESFRIYTRALTQR